MSIIAYASAAPSPLVSRQDAEIDLSVDTLPLDPVQLYGAGDDSAHPGASFTYSWTILAQPAGQTAAFDDATAQNPSIEDITLWGNVRAFLVVTNAATGLTSETNPLKAPDSAFVTVRLLSEIRGLQKPAAGERSYHTHTNQWAEVLEGLEGLDIETTPHTITEHTDVDDATGADLEALTSGGYADDPDLGDPNPGGRLHKHRGGDVDAATTVLRGTIKLESAPLDSANPKVINQERIWLTGTADGSQTALGYRPGIIVPYNYDGYVVGGNFAHAHIVWVIPEACTLVDWTVALKNGGSASPGTAYAFRLYAGNPSDYLTNDLVAVGTVATDTAAADRAPILITTTENLSVAAGKVLALVCTAAPAESDEDVPGGGLSVLINLRRRV